MNEKQLQLYEDLLEVGKEVHSLSVRIGRLAKRFSGAIVLSQPAHNSQRNAIVPTLSEGATRGNVKKQSYILPPVLPPDGPTASV